MSTEDTSELASAVAAEKTKTEEWFRRATDNFRRLEAELRANGLIVSYSQNDQSLVFYHPSKNPLTRFFQRVRMYGHFYWAYPDDDVAEKIVVSPGVNGEPYRSFNTRMEFFRWVASAVVKS